MSSPAKQHPSSSSVSISPADSAMQPDDSQGPWSDPALAATLASLTVMEDTAAIRPFSDFFGDEYVEENIAVFEARRADLESFIRDNQPHRYKFLVDDIRDTALELYLPALLHICNAMQQLGMKMRGLLRQAEKPSADEWILRQTLPYPSAIAGVMHKLKAWQERLMPLLVREMERAIPPIRVRALLQRQRMDLDEALESAVDLHLEAHFQAA